jgi:hypothetical protein
MKDYLAALEQALPAVFAGPEIDRLTAGIFTWKGIRTRRRRGQIPEACFGIRIGNGPIPMLKGPFLKWVGTEVASASDRPAASAEPAAATVE